LAGLVKGVIGLGLPTVAIGILGLVMAPSQAAAILIVPSLVTNVWQLAAGARFGALLKRLWPLLVGTCVGSWAGTLLFEGVNMRWAPVALGGALIAYVLIGLSAVQFSVPRRIEGWLGPLIGATTGIVTVATGIFVVPTVPYLQALEMDRDDLIQALGINFTVSTIALAGGLMHGGLLRPAILGFSAIALVTAMIGMFLGTHLRARIPPPVFRRCFFGGLLLLGCHLTLRGLL
ncbi:MAG TPA: sulfite exporter TauE/SafE family protein, partial [Burkholderiales bacterium]|nr:sulfite exporter TauE/SafE family protein [Burkholderiales bacterium]